MLPWLPYRLVYTYRLAEAGQISQATAYCTRLVAVFEKMPKPVPGLMVAKAAAADLSARLALHAQVCSTLCQQCSAAMAAEPSCALAAACQGLCHPCS